MLTPKGRGALSESLFAALRAMQADDDYLAASVPEEPDSVDDAQIALWALFELSYRGFEDVDPGLEWNPDLLRIRRRLEVDFEHRLHARFGPPEVGPDLAASIFDYVEGHDGRSVAAYVQRGADRDQVLELLRQRSVYHLKEADPTAWVMPRLPTATQAALTELLYDEYGGGDPSRVHARLYAKAMTASGLDERYGAYVDEALVEVLEQNNAMSLFGLHRRLRGAALGHLAAFEATSSLPSRRLVRGFERLGLPEEAVAYYAEHVEADAVHEQLAVRTICGSLAADDPTLVPDIFFGAFTCLDLEDRFAGALLSHWGAA